MTTSFVEKGGLLAHIVEGLHPLPAEVHRILTLMKELDTRVVQLDAEIDQRQDEYVKNVRTLALEERKSKLRELRALHDKTVALSDEKVELSNQLYEMVDKHICEVDKTLQDFEDEVREKCADGSLTLDDISPAASKAGVKSKAATGKTKGKKNVATRNVGVRVAPIFNIGKHKKWGQKWKRANSPLAVAASGVPAASSGPSASARVSGPTTPSKSGTPVPPTGQSPVSALRSYVASQLDMPVDPNEPTYCICNQVSFGEMIGCDNTECAGEWFHFPCMDLTVKPKGKWYCPNCAPLFSSEAK